MTIYDINDDGKSTVIASLTTSDMGPQTKLLDLVISSTSNKLLIESKSFYFSTSIHYSPLPSKECKKVLDMTKKTIQSPNYPDSYNNNLTCKWLISVPHSSHIILKFLQFEVRFLYD